MGLPAIVAQPYIDKAQPALAALGASASAAPNSVWIKNIHVDKSRPIRWLSESAEAAHYGFQLDGAVGFGDNPAERVFFKKSRSMPTANAEGPCRSEGA